LRNPQAGQVGGDRGGACGEIGRRTRRKAKGPAYRSAGPSLVQDNRLSGGRP
jgi:hypothetical protein